MSTRHRFKLEQFKVRMDWWVLVGALLTIGLVVVMIPLLFILNVASTVVSLVVALVLILIAAYYIDSYFYRVYILDKDALIIAGHIVRFVFPYRGMQTIAPGGFFDLFTHGGVISRRRHKRFALSRRNVRITFRKDDHHWTSISLSPNDPERFIHAIVERVEHERSSRTSDAR
jgi:hypothetical protein